MDPLSVFGIKIDYLSPEKMISLVRIAVLLVIGLPFVFFLSKFVKRVIAKRLSLQPSVIAGKIVYYAGVFIIFFSTLNELGFNLNTLLGAAGIVGIAVGFASQTSVSNIISGVFLMLERPFVINDTITIDDITGKVIAIDLLSAKLKTDDNRYIRIPNEHIIKTKLTNVTRYDIRRVDIRMSLPVRENIGRMRLLLVEAAGECEHCLSEPAPQVIMSGFGNTTVDIIFAVWTRQEEWQNLKNNLIEKIARRFSEEGIRIA
jgi:small-conductance mechanosensitive channel